MDDVHEILRHYIRHELKISVLDYCYLDDNKLEIDIAKEDYDASLKIKQIVTDEFVFKKKMGCEENKNSITLTFSYELKEDLDVSDDITKPGRSYGAIAPDGKFYACGYSGHNNLEYWLRQRGLISDTPLYTGGAFEYNGWMKLTGAMMTECEFVFDYELTEWNRESKKETVLKANKPTKAQFDTVKKYIESKKREFVNYNYEWYKLEDLDIIFEKGEVPHDFRYAKKDEYQIDGQEELNKSNG